MAQEAMYHGGDPSTPKGLVSDLGRILSFVTRLVSDSGWILDLLSNFKAQNK